MPQDTVVRWSAAKGVARISERLPAEFTGQVVDTVIGLFSIHSIAMASVYDMPAIAESTWHGACLCCAEFLRRGLIVNDQLADAITWMIKASLSSYLAPLLTFLVGLVFRHTQGGTFYRFQRARRCYICVMVPAKSLRCHDHRPIRRKTCSEFGFCFHVRQRDKYPPRCQRSVSGIRGAHGLWSRYI